MEVLLLTLLHILTESFGQFSDRSTLIYLREITGASLALILINSCLYCFIAYWLK